MKRVKFPGYTNSVAPVFTNANSNLLRQRLKKSSNLVYWYFLYITSETNIYPPVKLNSKTETLYPLKRALKSHTRKKILVLL